MRTISFNEFANRAKEMATKAGDRHWKVYVTLDAYGNFNFQLYVAGYSIPDGKSPEEVLAKMKEQIWPKKSNIEDVIIESEATHV